MLELFVGWRNVQDEGTVARGDILPHLLGDPFVLSEFTLNAAPKQDLENWQLVRAWDFGGENKEWSPLGTASLEVYGALQITSKASVGEVAVGEWYSVGPFFDGQAFDKPLGPEGKPIDLNGEFVFKSPV